MFISPPAWNNVGDAGSVCAGEGKGLAVNGGLVREIQAIPYSSLYIVQAKRVVVKQAIAGCMDQHYLLSIDTTTWQVSKISTSFKLNIVFPFYLDNVRARYRPSGKTPMFLIFKDLYLIHRIYDASNKNVKMVLDGETGQWREITGFSLPVQDPAYPRYAVVPDDWFTC